MQQHGQRRRSAQQTSTTLASPASYQQTFRTDQIPTRHDWRELREEFGRILLNDESGLYAVYHPPQLVTVELEVYPPGTFVEEHRWWTVSGPSGGVEAFLAIAEAAGKFLDAPIEYRWQWWLDFLRNARIGLVRFRGERAEIEEDLRVLSQRACTLLAAGLLATFLERQPDPISTKPDTRLVDTARDRAKRIRDFIANIWETTGEQIIEKDIWLVASYRDDSQFRAWKKGLAGRAYAPGGIADTRIRRAMNMPPKEFVRKARIVRPR